MHIFLGYCLVLDYSASGLYVSTRELRITLYMFWTWFAPFWSCLKVWFLLGMLSLFMAGRLLLMELRKRLCSATLMINWPLLLVVLLQYRYRQYRINTLSALGWRREFRLC